MKDALEILSRLLKVTGLTGHETAVMAEIAAIGAELGLRPSVCPDGVWFEVRAEAWSRSEGSDCENGPTVLLTSHLDTVPPGDGWTADPYAGAIESIRENEFRVCRGRGAVDARGSCIAMLLALHRTAVSGLPHGRAVAAFSIGEEGNNPSLPSLLPRLGKIDAAIVGEPTSMNIAISQKGLMVARLSTCGEQAHAARGTGPNAITLLSETLVRLSGVVLPAGLRVTPTRLAAGVADNVIPATAEAIVDVRIPPGMTARSAASILAENLPCGVEILSDRWIPCLTSADEPIFVSAAAALPNSLTYDSDAASDWVFLHEKGLPSLKIGPGDPARSHRPDEWISDGELKSGIDGYHRILIEYVSRNKPGEKNDIPGKTQIHHRTCQNGQDIDPDRTA